MTTLEQQNVVSKDKWLEAGAKLLAKEKELTRMRDEVSRLRRELPWTRIDKEYTFQTEQGPKTLSQLFGGKSTLILYHYMFGPGDKVGCDGCSFVVDHVDAARQHFENKGIAYVAVSRAPLDDFLPFKKRMGWKFDWVSSAETDFNYDFDASFHKAELAVGPVHYNFKMQTLTGEDQPGLTVFYKDRNGQIFRTYSTYERGLDMLIGAYNYIDLTPAGRAEDGPMDWVKFHDEYVK